MKIKSQTIYIFMVYTMLTAYMTGPMLSYLVGIPRIDNPLSMLFVLAALLIAFLENKRFMPKTGLALLSLALMSGWSAIHFFITPLEMSNYADLTFFLTIPAFFYLLHLIISRHADKVGFIRHLITVFTLFICIPPLIELLTSFQFVSGDEILAVEAGIIKGLFFNPNNLGTTALCLSPTVLLFFNLQKTSLKDTLIGWLLFLLLGFIIIASASRTATVCYLALFFLALAYRNNSFTVLLSTGLVALGLYSIPTRWIQDFLLSLYSNPFLENISSRLYLFLFDLEQDNSVSYRKEIYNYFWENPPFLFTGYGPKNFNEYFGGHLSFELGFENPHSFLIELYLGFGIISLLAFAGYVITYIFTMVTTHLTNKQRFFSLTCLAIFLIGGFIPSSILRLPFIWLPCFLSFIYATYALPVKHTVSRRQPYFQLKRL